MDVIIDGRLYVEAQESAKGIGLDCALDLRFSSDAGDNLTIRDYLKTLLLTLWNKGEGFSGKRPFGNSSWQYDLYKPLIVGGFISGELDEDGYIEDCDTCEAQEYVRNLILAAFCK